MDGFRKEYYQKPFTIPAFLFFFFNDTATTEIYTLSLHDALPICERWVLTGALPPSRSQRGRGNRLWSGTVRSEEHTSELQSRGHLVCRLLLEKKKTWSVLHAGPPPAEVAGKRPVDLRGSQKA